MENLLEVIIPSVSAQTLDAISQPTFGPIDIGNGNTSTASILLTADKTSTTVGERFKVKVKINTNGVQITEYRLTISFDASKFTVIDSDQQNTGTQIRNLEPLFEVENPSQNNTVVSAGRIRLIATSDEALSLNKDVAEIEFQAQTTGTAPINIVNEGELSTQLIRTSGIGLAYTKNTVDVTIAQSTQPGTNPDPNQNNGQQGQTPGQNNQNPGTIPDTALPDTFVQLLPFMLGMILLALGFSLTRGKKKDERA